MKAGSLLDTISPLTLKTNPMNIKAYSILSLSLLLSCSCYAQTSSGRYARIVTIGPHQGKSAEFTAGYKRHIQWHRDNKDPWTWFGWTIVLGPRLGYFMDGTFGHDQAELDHPIKPAEDAADNNTNVAPYADFLSHGIYERVDGLSKGPVLPDTSPYLIVNSYQVNLGAETKFEQAIARFNDARLTTYRLKTGGTEASYVLFRAGSKFSDAAVVADLQIEPGVVASATSELFRYQAAMSHAP